MSRARRWPAWRTALVLAGLVTIAATVVVNPPRKSASHEIVEGQDVVVNGDGGGTTDAGTTTSSGGGTTTTVVQPPRAGIQCAPGRNGGATDAGVTGTTIKLGATVVDSGIGASFLRDARFGMIAVKNQINRAGGICGRKIELELVDDGWDPRTGGEFLRNLVEDKKVFALSVVPSSEGLKTVSDAGYLKKKKIPVVGSDGMLIHQYTDPYIWPVAASTVSTMHIMAQQAHDRGAHTFGIVYEHRYHFGLEGAYAFNAAVKRLTGHDIEGYSNPLKNPKCEARFCGIAPGQPSYSTQIQTFNNACFSDPRCDFIALLLEPATALTWLKGGGIGPADGFRTGGPQPLFARSFAEECGTTCHNLMLWTGFDPPIGGNAGRAAVTEYVNLVKGASSSADVTSTFVTGAYVGMKLMVAALQRAGPDLTRARLIASLDSMTLQTGLSPPLSWSPGDHFANTTMQAWSIQFKDRFSGWRDERISMEDPWVGLDTAL